MNKSDLSTRLAKQARVSKAQAADQVDRVVHQIVRNLRKGQSARFPGAGELQSGREMEIPIRRAASRRRQTWRKVKSLRPSMWRNWCAAVSTRARASRSTDWVCSIGTARAATTLSPLSAEGFPGIRRGGSGPGRPAVREPGSARLCALARPPEAAARTELAAGD